MCNEDLPELGENQDYLRLVIPVDLLTANESRLRESAGDAAVRALRARRKRA
jgi:hypothetical protein